MWLDRFKNGKELSKGEIKRLGELGSSVDGDRLFAAFNGADIGAVQPATVGKLFL